MSQSQLQHDDLYTQDNCPQYLNKLSRHADKMNDRLKERATRATRYYKGDHWFDVDASNPGVVINLIYTGIETIVATMTDRTPEIVITPAGEEEEDIINANSVQKMIKAMWKSEDMQQKMEWASRHLALFGDAFATVRWNEDKGEFGNIETEIIHPEYIRVNPEALTIDDAEYFFITRPVALTTLRKKYGKKSKGISPMKTDDWNQHQDVTDDQDLSQSAIVMEFWGWVQVKEFEYELRHIIKSGDVVLENEKNPYFDYEGVVDEEEKERIISEYGSITEAFSKKEVDNEDVERDIEGAKKEYNFFYNERLPLIQFTSYGTNKQLQSDTSKTEQAIPANQLYNMRRTQINRNANFMAYPYWEVSKASGIDTNQFDDSAGTVYLVDEMNEMRMVPAPSMPAYIMDDAEMSRRDVDNLIGSHDISRGEVGSNRTARESIILKESDEGGIAILIRSMKRGMEDIGKWWVHLMMLKYTEEHTNVILGREGSEEYVSITRDDIDKGMRLHIQSGSIEPKDKNAEENRTLDMMNSGWVSPIYGLEKLGVPNPTEVYTDAELHKAGQLVELPGQGQPPGPPEQGGPPPEPGGPPPGLPQDIPPGPPADGGTVPVPQV